MRKDRKQNLKKVLKTFLKDPDQTLQQIADSQGLGVGTVHRALEELEKSGKIEKSKKIIELLDKDMKDIQAIQELEGIEIGKHLNLSRETVKTTLKDEEGNDVLDDNGNPIIEEREKWPMKAADLKAISQIAEMKQKRRAILAGDVTDKDGGLVSPEDRERSNTLINEFLKGDTSE